MKMRWVLLAFVVGFGCARLDAADTENHTTRVLAAPGPVAVDGKTDDWDLSGGTFACANVERFREHYAVWFHLMYDAENLYVLARWRDPTPLNNQQSHKGGHGFAGDCLQFRVIFDYQKKTERVSHLTCWRDKEGVLTADIAYGRKFKSGTVPNITAAGGKHAVARVAGQEKAYVQELAVPWTLIASAGWTPESGASFKVTVEPNFTAGPAGRISIKDLLYNPVGVPDRIFTFRAYKDWAVATLVDEGPVEPQSLVLADDREFKVSLVGGVPQIDWSPLFQTRELPGHKAIDFTMPFDGEVSLLLRNPAGEVVRHLLNTVPYQKGQHTVKWDGLGTPLWRTPTEVLPAGSYRWEAVAHKPFSLTLRGWAHCHGTPWNAGKTAGWGGDHGAPRAVARYGKTMILGWSGSEAGYGIVAVDGKGDQVWHLTHGPTGGAPHFLAVDGDVLVGLGWAKAPGRQLFKVNAGDGNFLSFARNGKAAIHMDALAADKKMPGAGRFAYASGADCMDARDGAIYLGFGRTELSASHVADWNALATYLAGEAPLARSILTALAGEKHVDRYRQRLRAFAQGKVELKKVYTTHRNGLETALFKVLNREFLDRADLFPGSQGLEGKALREANRAYLAEQFGGIKPLKSNFVLLLDLASGQIRRALDVPAPTFLHAESAEALYVISDNRRLLRVHPETGAQTVLMTGEGLEAVTVDMEGNLVVAQGAPQHQIVVASPAGKELRRLGRPGGRRILGPWDRAGLHEPRDLAFDAAGRLWVMEHDRTPKRISVWDYAKGGCVDEFFGPTHYGASGACINPLDPDIMISEGVEWRLDAKSGRGVPTGVIINKLCDYSAFATPENGRLYWVRTQRQYRQTPQVIQVYERLGEGEYVLRSEITREFSKDAAQTLFWSDADGDQERDDGETKSVPLSLGFGGQWWLNAEVRNLTLVAMVHDLASQKRGVQAIEVAGFTPCGAPVWAVETPIDLSFTFVKDGSGKPVPGAYKFGHMVPARDGKTILSLHTGARGGSHPALECFEMATGTRRWWYPNQWHHVHGGHRAPPPEPGLLRATFGIIGAFQHPVVGNVWVINTDKGEWHMVSEKGFFVGTVFETDPMEVQFPPVARPGADMTMAPPGSGAEDFGGSVTQAPDGSVYLQSGKIGAWNLKLEGLDTIQAIGAGTVTVQESEIALAQAEFERQKQAATGKKMLEIVQKAVEFTGNARHDFRGAQSVKYQKGNATRAETWAAYDAERLYLAYHVSDPTPWVNGAGEAITLYQSGDTVDFQFGSDPAADRKRREATKGDFRLSIGNFKDKPTAVLYRKVWDQKKPREFTSGVIKSYVLDYVAVLESAEIKVNVDAKARTYTVEVAVPFAALGFTPDKTALYKADFGVTHGDPAGERTRLRSHWNNQQTGLVADAVFELQMQPQNWGVVKFK